MLLLPVKQSKESEIIMCKELELATNDHFFVLNAPVCSTGVFDKFEPIDYKLYNKVYEMFDEASLIYVGY